MEWFFQEPAGECGEDKGSHCPTEPPVEEYEKWVEWRGEAVDTPSWWWELGKIPDVDDVQELAQKIWTSFQLPKWMSEVHGIKNYYLAPLAPNCLCQKDFLLPPDPRFLCWDIWEEQLKKTITYAQALQYWAKMANPAMAGKPHLLARSILELCEMMGWYVSFCNDIVLDSVALLEGFFRNQMELTVSRDAPPASTNVPTKEVTMEEAAPIRGPLKEPTTPWVPHEK